MLARKAIRLPSARGIAHFVVIHQVRRAIFAVGPARSAVFGGDGGIGVVSE